MTSNSVKPIEKLVEVDSGAGKEQQNKIRLIMMMILMMITTMTSVFSSFFITLYKAKELLRRTDFFLHLICTPKRSYAKFFDIINTVSLMTCC
jgi:hypothetical protein